MDNIKKCDWTTLKSRSIQSSDKSAVNKANSIDSWETDRVIAHIDLDSFYASVECLYNPQIRLLPVAVGGDSEQRHGVILAKNQIAKQFGVKTGDTLIEAKKKCPNIIFVKGHFERYLKISKMVKEIYYDYTDKIESFGIDEAWLDLTGSTTLLGSPVKIIQEIQQRIHTEIGITASAGISYNKVFAKLGSDQNKPYGLFVVTKDNYKDKIWHLPASDLLYVGKSTEKKLNLLNIKTIGDIAKCEDELLFTHLGKNGLMLKTFASGEDKTPVSFVSDERFVKTIGNSKTLPRDITTNDDVYAVFCMLSESVATRLREHNLKCKGLQISVRDNTLSTIQIQDHLENATFLSTEIANNAFSIYLKKYSLLKPIRSLGIRAINLISDEGICQLDLLDTNLRREKMEILEKTIDNIRDTFGYDKVQKGVLLVDRQLTKRDIKKTNSIHPISYTYKD